MSSPTSVLWEFSSYNNVMCRMGEYFIHSFPILFKLSWGWLYHAKSHLVFFSNFGRKFPTFRIHHCSAQIPKWNNTCVKSYFIVKVKRLWLDASELINEIREYCMYDILPRRRASRQGLRPDNPCNSVVSVFERRVQTFRVVMSTRSVKTPRADAIYYNTPVYLSFWLAALK